MGQMPRANLSAPNHEILPPQIDQSLETADNITYWPTMEIARGGCSTIHLAHDFSARKHIVLKVAEMSSNASQEKANTLLQREYDLLDRLDPGLGPQVFKFGRMAGTDKACMVMEHLEGEDVDRLRAKLHGLKTSGDFDQLMEIGKQAVGQVAALHEKGIVHCDVKPSNFMFHNNHLRILDFGIAILVGGNHELISGHIMGTPPYMSLESFVSPDNIQFSRDVFALGAMLYELMTGRVPSGESLREIQLNAINPDFLPEPPSLVFLRDRPDLEKDLSASQLEVLKSRLGIWDSIVMKAISRGADHRYPDAGQMLDDFRKFETLPT
jgi:serine/threonine protein kinase